MGVDEIDGINGQRTNTNKHEQTRTNSLDKPHFLQPAEQRSTCTASNRCGTFTDGKIPVKREIRKPSQYPINAEAYSLPAGSNYEFHPDPPQPGASADSSRARCREQSQQPQHPDTTYCPQE